MCKYHTTPGRASGILLCSPKKAPVVDLTRYGVEPNPGPPKQHKKHPKRKGPSKMKILKMAPAQPGGRKITGKGGYVTDVASKAGSWLGSKAGGWLEKLFGLGEYTVKKNSLYSKANSTSPNDPPAFSNSAGGTIVTHREFIQDIVSTTSFVNQVFPINPGLSLTHPWVSNIGPSFTQYRPLGIIFEYKSTSTTAISTSTNQQAGVVIMATNYNVLEPAFTDKRTMENYTYVTSCSPYENAIHPVECDPVTLPVRELYVRSTSVGDNDLRFNDLGNFQIATSGMPANGGKIGELWASYQYELLKPRLPTSTTSVSAVHYQFNSTLNPSLVRPTAAALFGELGLPGSKVVAKGVGSTTIKFNPSVPNNILFNTSGRYIIMLQAVGTAATILVNPSTYQQGVTPAAIFSLGAGSVAETYITNGISCLGIAVLTAVDVDLSIGSGPQGIQYNTSTIPSTITNLDLFVFPVPPNFTMRNPHIPMSIDEQLFELRNRLLEIEEERAPGVFIEEHKATPRVDTGRRLW